MGDGNLLLANIFGHCVGIALQRVAIAAGTRHFRAEGFAAFHWFDELGWRFLAFPFAYEVGMAEATRLASENAPARVDVPVSAKLYDRVFGQQPVLPHQAEGPAVFARPASVRQKPVLVDQQRVFRLDDFDGRVGHVAEPVGAGVLSVRVRAAAASGDVVKFH